MFNTGVISSINPDVRSSWEGKIFLTFDIDWAHDDVFEFTIDMVERTGVSATWFITHDTPLLDRLRSNPLFELGIHPNFNDLLRGDSRLGSSIEAVLDFFMEIVPEAKTVRSHSMTQNSRILDLFAERGLTHDCNHFIPWQSGIQLKPWFLWNSMIRCPYFWEDDLAIAYGNHKVSTTLEDAGLKVYDFHPIHIFLNTENLERYNRTRSIHYYPDKLIKERFLGNGTLTQFEQLLSKTI